MDRCGYQGRQGFLGCLCLDEIIQDFKLGYEGKRDRWNGYNPADHSQTIKEFEMIEAERKKIREAEAKAKLESGDLKEDSDEDEDDEFKYADGADVPGQRVRLKTRN
jgi:pre-mRNA-processing factor SLU7